MSLNLVELNFGKNIWIHTLNIFAYKYARIFKNILE